MRGGHARRKPSRKQRIRGGLAALRGWTAPAWAPTAAPRGPEELALPAPYELEVTGLPARTSAEELRAELEAQFGPVLAARVLPPAAEAPRAPARVRVAFADAACADALIRLCHQRRGVAVRHVVRVDRPLPAGFEDRGGDEDVDDDDDDDCEDKIFEDCHGRLWAERPCGALERYVWGVPLHRGPGALPLWAGGELRLAGVVPWQLTERPRASARCARWPSTGAPPGGAGRPGARRGRASCAACGACRRRRTSRRTTPARSTGSVCCSRSAGRRRARGARGPPRGRWWPPPHGAVAATAWLASPPSVRGPAGLWGARRARPRQRLRPRAER
ncbi:unnamed protein product, partial [Prorocentrum cordatum]